MPIPKPGKTETQDVFISRCMGDAVMNAEYPDQKQRSGICYTQWRQKEKAKYKCQDCTHETDNSDSEDTVCPQCGGELITMARRVGGFESPEPGDIPEQGKKILAAAYASCRKAWVKDHPDDKENKDNKARCAKIAWAAVDNAGYSKQKMKLETREIENVEIFATGNWKGHEYTKADLDEAVLNFDDHLIEPYITLDHKPSLTKNVKEWLDATSLGFVKSLKRVEGKLVAGFKQVPAKIADLIEAGALKKRSVEYYIRNYKHANGKLYNNVLEAVTFHGANGVPAVNTLSDIMQFYKMTAKKLVGHGGEKVTIDFKTEEDDLKMGEIKIDQAEYDRLKANQRKEEDSEAMKKLKADKVESDKKAEENEAAKLKAEKDAADSKKKMEDMKTAELAAEAESFMKKVIEEDNKLAPKFKDMKKAEYIRLKKAGDEDGLKLFKEELEARDKILNFGPIAEDGATGSPTKFKSTDDDVKGDPTARAEATVQAIMKRDNCTWKEANEKAGLGADGGEE